ncbi:MAG: PAS domain-containing protein [Chloroflexi bacterium]|nr:PAS domain-containing protein [Chloroflexota bacterium]
MQDEAKLKSQIEASEQLVKLHQRVTELESLVAEREQVKDALRDSKQLLENALEAITHPFYVIDVNDHTVKMANSAACTLGDLLENETCYALSHRVDRPCHETGMPCPLVEVKKTKQPVELEHVHYDQNGNARHVQVRGYPVFDSAGNVVQMIEYSLDITEQKQVEVELRKLNEELEQRVRERVRDLQAEIAERRRADEELRQRHEELITLNTITTALGQSRDLDDFLSITLDVVLELVGSTAGCVHLMNEESQVLLLTVQHGLSQKETEKIKMVPLSNVQSEIDLSIQFSGWISQSRRQCLTVVPIEFRGVVLGLLSIFCSPTSFGSNAALAPVDGLDLKQRQILAGIGLQVGMAIENDRLTREAAKANVAQELDHLRSELIGNVSHELRTPLGLIKAATSTLLAEDVEFDHQVQQRLLRGIDKETDRLTHIVSNLLDLSRMEQKGLYLHRSPTDIGQLTKDVIDAMQVQTTRCRFAHDFPTSSLVANVDVKRVDQVLRNLLDNAVKYSPDGGLVSVKGQETTGQLLISVSDEGIGIPSSDLNRIFERFYRIDNEATRVVSGVGLGLAISRKIIKVHGGDMWVESVLGQGSTFYFTLPVV